MERQQLLKADDIQGFLIGKQKYRLFFIWAANTPYFALWMTRWGIVVLACFLMSALPVNPNQAAAAESTYPLEPLDTSSPRATLSNFPKTCDEAIRFYRNDYQNEPGRVNHSRFRSILSKPGRALDLSKVSAAARKQEGVDSIGLLYDILSKIELPPEKTIPGAETFADDAAKTPAYWKIPHTEITIARIEEGPRAGEFLFTSQTVKRLEEFYARVRNLPVRREVALENVRFYLRRSIMPATTSGHSRSTNDGFQKKRSFRPTRCLCGPEAPKQRPFMRIRRFTNPSGRICNVSKIATLHQLRKNLWKMMTVRRK